MGRLRKKLNRMLIVEVLAESPAQMSGLKATELQSDGTIVLGNLVTEINGEVVLTVVDLLFAIEACADGDTVALKIWRSCDENIADITRVKLSTSDKLQR